MRLLKIGDDYVNMDAITKVSPTDGPDNKAQVPPGEPKPRVIKGIDITFIGGQTEHFRGPELYAAFVALASTRASVTVLGEPQAKPAGGMIGFRALRRGASVFGRHR